MARHLGLVFRGTGGIVGQDYVSRVLQAVSNLVEEVNPNFPATMGGLPVGTAGSISDPSMSAAVLTAVEDAKLIFLARKATNPRVKVVVGGYSAGAVAAAMFRQWLQANHPDHYLCSFSLGDPTRPSKGAFFAGKPTSGHGISSWRYGDVTDWRHCWLAQPGDMYTSVPEGDTGLIMGDFYDIVTHVALSDPLGTMMAMFEKLPDLLVHCGILGTSTGHLESGALDLGSIVTSVEQLLSGKQTQANPANWLGSLLGGGSSGGLLNNPFLGIVNSLTGLLDGEPDGLAAAINAAIVGIKFVADQPPTRAHITYEFGEVWPGQTYLGLAIQHVRDWASRTPAA